MHNPRAEARHRLGEGFDPRVLEPSPPAVDEPPFFADDPLAGGDVLPVRRRRARTWQQVCMERADDALTSWCAERWLLGPASRPLHDLAPNYTETRHGLHALAEHVLAPRRHQANGKVGLRFTAGGFGTPFFGDNHQLRVDGAELVDGDRRQPLTTLGEAASFVGVVLGQPTGVYEPSTPADPGTRLEPSVALGDWFGFCAAVLEQLRADATDEDAPGRVQLWPEHFDIAVDLGATGERANYGGSPGDPAHAEPYLYVGPWDERSGGFWNEPWGASLSYSDIRAGADPLDFLREGRSALRR